MNNTGARDALIEQIKKSDNILVALSANPTIDELTAALGLTLILNKTNDHVTTIFSGEVPSVLNFLEPNKFFDKTVDGLRDFIIALNPDKADRVRTKVVDGMVRVSITPSKGAVTVNDLEFSQGDYNVDLVIALGVENQADLDKALEAHGRILHSAFVASIGVGSAMTDLGNLNWQEPALQSYAQIVADLSLNLDPKLDENGQPVDTVLIDSSVATALMTGLVSITERFSNNLTTPEIMSLAAVLMGQGANQQLIAKELDEPNKIAALKQSLNQKNQAQVKAEVEAAPKTEPKPEKPENKLEHEAVINHKEAIVAAEATEEQSQEAIADQAVDINQIIDKMVENSQAKQVETEVESGVEAKAEAPADLTPVEPPVAPEPVDLPVNQVASEVPVADEPTLGEMAEPVLEAEQKTDTAKPVKDESWEKVNQFKQAFLDKMKQNEAQAEQARQAGLDEIKQAEPPEPPQAEKLPIEVAEPVFNANMTTKTDDQSDDDSYDEVDGQSGGSGLDESEQPNDSAGDFIEIPREKTDQVEPAPIPAESTPAAKKNNAKSAQAKFLSDKVKKLKNNLKKKPNKVIKPLEKPPQTGPTIKERIEQELNPVAPPVPPMPAGLDLPPPLPPMPPALDQLTMTSLPPVETGLDNNPFDALEMSTAPVAAPKAPALANTPASNTPVPPIPQPAPVAPQPAPTLAPQSTPPAPQPASQPVPMPNLDTQLTPQEAKSIGLTPPAPTQPKQPVPQNQFVIPE